MLRGAGCSGRLSDHMVPSPASELLLPSLTLQDLRCGSPRFSFSCSCCFPLPPPAHAQEKQTHRRSNVMRDPAADRRRCRPAALPQHFRLPRLTSSRFAVRPLVLVSASRWAAGRPRTRLVARIVRRQAALDSMVRLGSSSWCKNKSTRQHLDPASWQGSRCAWPAPAVRRLSATALRASFPSLFVIVITAAVQSELAIRVEWVAAD